MKKFLTCLLCLALLVTMLAGCGQKSELTTVRLSEVTHSVFYAPLYAALELGFFEEEGLEIELSNGGGADKVMTAVLAGQADVGLAGPESCVYVHNEGREDAPVVFGQLTKRDGSFLVGREDEEFSWENLRGTTILGGRKGGVPEMTLEYVLKQNGLIPGEDVTVDTSIQFNMMAGAFTGGNGDYVALFEPTATQVELEGKGYVLTSIGLESGEIPYTAFFAAESYLESHADTVQKFTNAVYRGQQWVLSHTAAEIAEAIAPQFPDTDMDVLTAVCQRHLDIDAWNDTPIMEEEALDRLQTVMETAGELDQRASYEDLVDNSFAEAAIS
jgi:NitT/TauT family transport system substrate-binding protein